MAWGDAWGGMWGGGKNQRRVTAGKANAKSYASEFAIQRAVKDEPKNAPTRALKDLPVSRPESVSINPALSDAGQVVTLGVSPGISNHRAQLFGNQYRAQIAPAPAVPIDNGIHFPLVAEFPLLASPLPQPTHLWLCQDAGPDPQDLAEEVSSNDWPTSGVGPRLYGQPVAGFARKCVVSQDGLGVGSLWEFSGAQATAAGLDLSVGSSITYYIVVETPVSTGFHSVPFTFGSTNNRLQFRGAGNLRFRFNASNFDSALTGYEDGSVQPFLININRTVPGADCFTLREKIVATPSAGAGGGVVQLGSEDATLNNDIRIMYAAAWVNNGQAADKTWLTALGWSLSY